MPFPAASRSNASRIERVGDPGEGGDSGRADRSDNGQDIRRETIGHLGLSSPA
jgi:hypothetical protein